MIDCEPNLISHHKIKLNSFDTVNDNSDLFVFLVAHNAFKKLNIPKEKIIDYCGITDKFNLN